MYIAFTGGLGQYKTLGMTAICVEMAKTLNVPYYANYTVEGMKEKITSLDQLLKIEEAIIMIDEIYINMDARLWKNNIKGTRFILQTRKKKLILAVTSQKFSFMDLRLRYVTDYIVLCKKIRKEDHKEARFTFINYSGDIPIIGRTYKMELPEKYYNLYDTNEIIEPMKGLSLDENRRMYYPSKNRDFGA